MTWNTRSFALGDVLIEVPQALSFSQTYQEIGGVATHRTLNGTAIRQYNWTKLHTTLTGEGMVPPGLSAIRWELPQTLKCAVGRQITSPTNVITLPSMARTDTGYTPVGFALVDGFWRPTAISVVAQVATLTTVVNAYAYMVEYLPELTVYVQAPQIDVDRTQSTYRWTIDAEEV